MYQKVSTDMNFVRREEDTLSFWQTHGIPKQIREAHPEGPQFVQYDGPPTANGKPHIGHILTRAIKDVIPRYRRMKGDHVAFKAGWDTHGLPVELEVEKELGINGKPQIEAYGLEPFIQKCKSSVWRYKDEWERISERVAYSADMEDPYVTYDNPYIESEWWALKQIAEKGLLYEGYKIQPYCPRCGTALASHEVAQGYKDVRETSAFVRFAVEGEDNTWFAAWTTTPWTLPSNVALAVHPEARYALVHVQPKSEEGGETHFHEGCSCCCGSETGRAHAHAPESDALLKLDPAQAGRYWVAEELVSKLFGNQVEILRTCSGRELERCQYRPLFPYALGKVQESGKAAYYVTCAEYVTLTDGTGIVHIAPAFGEEDAQVGRAYDLPFVQLVREDGTLSPETEEFAGQFCKDADRGILSKMGKELSLLAAIAFTHSYPHCWRCDTPLIYYARHSWFIRMSALREELVQNNQKVNWIPKTIGEGRFGYFVSNAMDWALSRERYWGTPLPVWKCPDCGQIHVVGSIEELRSLSDDCPESIELHRPYIDAVTLRCPHCQGQMHRVPEVIDCWFDSGSMPFAQYHYPFENQELFQQNFPAHFISEAVDQTRGWFYSMLSIATLLFDRSSYENVIVLGHVQDKDGIKMSKHKGNVIAPQEAIDRNGADAVRWYFYTNSNPWLPSRFSFEAVSEGQRRFLSTLWNTYAFYILYAEIDQFDPTGIQMEYQTLPVMDRWILSRLQTLVQAVETALDAYEITEAARAIQEFTEQLSNWYVRRCRERFWAEGMEQDKVQAYWTLYTVLEQLIRLAAPFVPFITEQIYQNLVRSVQPEAPESVHLTAFPASQPTWVDAKLEADMEEVQRLVVLGRAARTAGNSKTRQPLAEMRVVSPNRLPEDYQQLILEELNVQTLTYVDDADGMIDYRFKPQLKTLGKRFGSRLPALRTALEALDGSAAWKTLQENGAIEITVEGSQESLAEADLLIERVQKSDLAMQQDRELTVVLDLNLTPELVALGLMRELVSKIQTMRKETNFEVTDRIQISYHCSDELEAVWQQYRETILEETLAVSATRSLDKRADSREWNINGLPCSLFLQKEG